MFNQLQLINWMTHLDQITGFISRGFLFWKIHSIEWVEFDQCIIQIYFNSVVSIKLKSIVDWM